ncbi:MAG: hypothetical protein JW841_05360 [Deltaproteobacteria bacterium]|nr:hypothetical protein [Deltaproteobacteria bacterium]
MGFFELTYHLRHSPLNILYNHDYYLFQIIGYAIIAAAMIVLQFITLRSRFNATPLAIGAIAMLMLNSVCNAIVNLGICFESVSSVAKEQQAMMMAAGISNFLETQIISLILLAILVSSVFIATALRSRAQTQAS